MAQKATDQKDAAQSAHKLIVNWPVFAPSALVTLLISVPMLPLLATTLNSSNGGCCCCSGQPNEQHTQWWLVIGFLIGPVGLVGTGLIALLFRPEQLLEENKRFKYMLRGKKLSQPHERMGSLTRNGGEKVTKGTEKKL